MIIKKEKKKKKERERKGGRKKRQMEEVGEDYGKRQIITKERHKCNKLWQSYGTSSSMAPALSSQ